MSLGGVPAREGLEEVGSSAMEEGLDIDGEWGADGGVEEGEETGLGEAERVQSASGSGFLGPDPMDGKSHSMETTPGVSSSEEAMAISSQLSVALETLKQDTHLLKVVEARFQESEARQAQLRQLTEEYSRTLAVEAEKAGREAERAERESKRAQGAEARAMEAEGRAREAEGRARQAQILSEQSEVKLESTHSEAVDGVARHLSEQQEKAQEHEWAIVAVKEAQERAGAAMAEAEEAR
ncbi:unnamed protein product, partial [Discosporangium mesarthrocarpum]